MDPRSRRLGLLVAVAVLVLVDLAIRRFDVFSPLVADTVPATLFAAVNAQVTDVVRALRAPARDGFTVVLLGNSQMDLGSRPLPMLRDALVAAGAPPDTRIVPLFVYASTITDAEVIARSLAPLHPAVVVLGVSAPDLATAPENARRTPVLRILETGSTDGALPAVDLEERLDRWVRSVWQLYRYRALFSDLLFPVSGKRSPRGFSDEPHSEEEVFVEFSGPERGREIAALRPGFESGDDYGAAARYVDALQGPGYLRGLRERWRTASPEAVQLAALRGFARRVREAGARPVVVLMPENPLLERDPDVGRVVRARSDAAADALESEAAAVGIAVVDLRRGFPTRAFLDMNHLFFQHGGMAPRLASELAARGLLAARS
ncbi:MAG TPA: hypothetical protein VFD92_15140 [Candidatus Binatia bacterium]|nr:hypothetical protein [Candidatus Binatia bacterium]